MQRNAINSNWFKIDNAANLYAATRNRKWTRTFRGGVVLDEEIKPEILQQAFEDTIKRYPSFSVKLKDGIFWSYLEKTKSVPQICEDTYMPYRSIQLDGTDQPAIRISYYKNRISYEVFHSVSDGAGSTKFLITLVARYFELQGTEIDHNLVDDVNDAPNVNEVRDDYVYYSSPNAKAKDVPAANIYLNENNAEKDFVQLINGLIKVDEIKEVAKKYSLTITEYLTANLIYMFIQNSDKPIYNEVSVSVPINLRTRFESTSVRNFTYMDGVSFNPNGRTDITFSEICDHIRGELGKKTQNEKLISEISANVSAQSNPVIKVIPYPIKKVFLIGSYKKSQQSYTIFFSNIGNLSYSPAVDKHILRLESALGCTPHSHFGCTAASINGLLNFTFCSSNHDTKKQMLFFRHLAEDGVNVRIESNIKE